MIIIIQTVPGTSSSQRPEHHTISQPRCSSPPPPLPRRPYLVSGSFIIFGSTRINTTGSTIIITIGLNRMSVMRHCSRFRKYWYGPRGRSFSGYGSCVTCGYDCTQALVLVLILYWYGPRGRSFNGYGSCVTCGVRLYSDTGTGTNTVLVRPQRTQLQRVRQLCYLWGTVVLRHWYWY